MKQFQALMKTLSITRILSLIIGIMLAVSTVASLISAFVAFIGAGSAAVRELLLDAEGVTASQVRDMGISMLSSSLLTAVAAVSCFLLFRLLGMMLRQGSPFTPFGVRELRRLALITVISGVAASVLSAILSAVLTVALQIRSEIVIEGTIGFSTELLNGNVVFGLVLFLIAFFLDYGCALGGQCAKLEGENRSLRIELEKQAKPAEAEAKEDNPADSAAMHN